MPLGREERRVVTCSCTGHLMSIARSEYACDGTEPTVRDRFVEIGLWEKMPTPHHYRWWTSFFYVPKWTWKIRQIGCILRGQHMSEEVVIDLNNIDAFEEAVSWMRELSKVGA